VSGVSPVKETATSRGNPGWTCDRPFFGAMRSVKRLGRTGRAYHHLRRLLRSHAGETKNQRRRDTRSEDISQHKSCPLVLLLLFVQLVGFGGKDD
jgi:hypothetical protein